MRSIPILLFVMHEDHPIRRADVETGPNASKLDALRVRMLRGHVTDFFRSPEDLRGHVIDALSDLRDSRPAELHYVRDIPRPPEPYIAHPYTLLSTSRLIGRQQELNHLTDWVARPGSEVFAARVLSVVAIGGMGKSALTWKLVQRGGAPGDGAAGRAALVELLRERTPRVDRTSSRAALRLRPRAAGRARTSRRSRRPERGRATSSPIARPRTPFLLVLDGLGARS